jgi:hypothetical protein
VERRWSRALPVLCLFTIGRQEGKGRLSHLLCFSHCIDVLIVANEIETTKQVLAPITWFHLVFLVWRMLALAGLHL